MSVGMSDCLQFPKSKSSPSEKKILSRIAISEREILLAHSYEDSQITINEMVAFVDRAPAL